MYSCDTNYIGYTSRHLHLRIEEHKYSVIGKHLKDEHNLRPNNLHEQFAILRKCHGKFKCLIYEMLLIRKKRQTLNTQKDSIPVKLFIQLCTFFCFCQSCPFFCSPHITFYSNVVSHFPFFIYNVAELIIIYI